MADPEDQLRTALEKRNVAAAAAAAAEALDAGADPNAVYGFWTPWTPLTLACWPGHLACVRLLLAAGADPNAAPGEGSPPLHIAARRGHAACVEALLAAGADPTAYSSGKAAVHEACARGHTAVVAALLAAAPDVAVAKAAGWLPIKHALQWEHYAVARCLLECGTLPPPTEMLEAFDWAACNVARGAGAALLWDLHAMYMRGVCSYVAHQPLTPAEWALVPTPCPGLGAAMPAVLARSEAEAAVLLARLPADDVDRLRTAALCLRRVERVHGLDLPPAIVRSLVLAALE